MSDVTFYHQERVDGGRRSGLHVDGQTVLHGFVPGAGEERDPALAWYVDVTVNSGSPPGDSSALAWLHRHWIQIRAALAAAADQLSCGIDPDTLPWEFDHTGPEGSVRVSVSAMRRLTARHIGAELVRLAGMELDQLFPVLAPHG